MANSMSRKRKLAEATGREESILTSEEDVASKSDSKDIDVADSRKRIGISREISEPKRHEESMVVSKKRRVAKCVVSSVTSKRSFVQAV